MALNLQESFERSCRLCAEEQEATILIFSAEAEAMLLQNKLNSYLLIEIEEDDKLPKNICIPCCTKLQSVCEFIDTARKSQEVLLNRSLFLEQVTGVNHQMNSKIPFVQSPLSDDDSAVTEMEISVDPMMVLQNAEEPKDTLQITDECEDVSYLHGLENENVTLKLIKKDDPQKFISVISEEYRTKKGSEKPFRCGTCQRSFWSELALKNHSWIHNGSQESDKQFRCSKCGEGFDYRMDLLTHAKEHRKNNTCKICRRIFRNEMNLKVHMETHIVNAVNAHVCKICGRSYNTRSILKTHSITHSNDRPYKCNLCKKSFKRNQDLKFHINQHTGAKPYKCPFCDKSFASSGNCYSHRSRMHPGLQVDPRPVLGRRRVGPRDVRALKPPMVNVKGVIKYQCQLCDHSFMKRDNYTYHMYQHTGEKPFQCSFCSEEFVTRKGLFIHHDKEHPSMERPLALISKNLLLK